MELIYLRTSTQEQNPENQLKDCLTLIKGEYEIVEEKESGWRNKDRPLFDLVKQRIKSGEVESLICWDWDRLFRNRKKLKEFFVLCKYYNCEIHSFRQNFFEDFYKIPKPFDEIIQDLVLNLMGWLAEDESKKKSETVKIAFQNHKGKKWGRKGLSDKTKKEILELHKEGFTLREISDRVFIWNKRNNKKKVSKSAVHKCIKEFNP